jgi:SAM-dependent methyltransferase
MFNTPILFIVFNRLSTTKQVFERIKVVKPKYLFIAADGPRKDKPDDEMKCAEVQNFVLGSIDWDCEVKTLFRNENLGCGRGPAEAISWFFENVEMGIILEDDTLPNYIFFEFCEILLKKYINNYEIMHIGGHSIGVHHGDYMESYYFSAYNHIWGWATWRRAWNLYNFKIDEESVINIDDHLRNYFVTNNEVNFWKRLFIDNSSKIDIWDYQWTHTILKNNGKSILPTINLVKNIGFDENATHTFKEPIIIKKAIYTDKFKSSILIHPENEHLNKELDLQMSNFYFNINAALSPITNRDNVVLERTLSTGKIIDWYKKTLNIDVTFFLKGVIEIKVFKCLDSGYRFYYPFNISGDGGFYEKLQSFDWYYMPWKWEHRQVCKYLKPGMKVLEVGCGKGDFLGVIEKKYSVQASGLELNPQAVSYANNKGRKVSNQLVQLHAIERPEYYDVVCSFQVLEHVFDVIPFIRGKLNCLKKGGKLIIGVPNNDSFIKHDFENSYLNMPPHHMGLWDTESLKNITDFLPLKLDILLYEPIQNYHKLWYKQAINNRFEKFSKKKNYDRFSRILPKYLRNKMNSAFIRIISQFTTKRGHTIIAIYTKL